MRMIVLTAAALLLAPPAIGQTAGSGRPPETATEAPPTGTPGQWRNNRHHFLPRDEDGLGAFADGGSADKFGRHEG